MWVILEAMCLGEGAAGILSGLVRHLPPQVHRIRVLLDPLRKETFASSLEASGMDASWRGLPGPIGLLGLPGLPGLACLPTWPACLACRPGLPAWPACLACMPGLPGLLAWLACLHGLPTCLACLALA